jgi:anhydro-N-acetylmuramic acid kinase
VRADRRGGHHFSGGLAYDADGALAARGTVHEPLLRRLLDEPYYALPAPKTTGKELFHLGYLQDALAGLGTLPAEDVIATLTLLTARTVADAVRSVAATEVIASGGGTRNPVLMAMLAAELPGVPLRTSDELGLPSAAKEAYAFAVLGFLTLHGLAGTDPPGIRALGSPGMPPSVLGSVCWGEPGRDGLPRVPRGWAEPVRVRLVIGAPARGPAAGAPKNDPLPTAVPSAEWAGSSHPGFHRRLIRWTHDAGDSPRLVPRSRADD